MSKNILIFGGARFHGFQLAKRLAKEGNSVSVLNRGNFRKIYPFGITQIIGDREKDISSLKKKLSEIFFDCIIDNNAYTPNQIKLIPEIIHERCNHYIFISSASVYLKTFSDHKLKEEEADGNSNGKYNPFFEQYALNKFLSEEEVKRIGKKEYTLLRLPNIFGEGDFSGKLSLFYSKLKNNGKIILEKEINEIGIIYVKDLVNQITRIINNEKSFGKTINLSCSTTIDELFTETYGKQSLENLVFIPSQEIWKNNYSLPFEWNPPLETSILQSLIGETNYTPVSEWGKRTLAWEENNLENIKIPEFSNRGRELKLIEQYND